MQVHLTPHHHARQIGFGHLAPGLRSHHTPIAQHTDAIADRQHLVELVRNKDDSVPTSHHLLEDDEELIDFLRREHRRRLVEDQQRCTPVESLEDLHPLLLAYR